MRIAVTSDIHLGDPASTLAFRNENGEIDIGSRYYAFVNTIKQELEEQIDYLILAGDILDFSITNYNEAYDIGEFFFKRLQQDKVAKEIIYIPGNHDFDIWHTIEYQVNVINKFEKNKLPAQFRMSVPGIIDTRKDSPHPGFSLVGVTSNNNPDQPKYAGLFLDKITDPPTPFNFAYPNLYLVTENESVLITHGQYLEQYWSVMGRWAVKIAPDDLKIKDSITMRDLVAYNFPLCQFACSGIGQAGNLTEIVLQLEHEIKEKRFERLDKYFNRVDKDLDQLLEKHWLTNILEPLENRLFNSFRKMVENSLAQIGVTRYSDEFIHDEAVQERFLEYYAASVKEIEGNKTNYNYHVPIPRKVIFGHTHQPIPWGAPNAPEIKPSQIPGIQSIFLYNTGGWLQKEDAKGQTHFCGAAVFLYDESGGIRSISIN